MHDHGVSLKSAIKTPLSIQLQLYRQRQNMLAQAVLDIDAILRLAEYHIICVNFNDYNNQQCTLARKCQINLPVCKIPTSSATGSCRASSKMQSSRAFFPYIIDADKRRLPLPNLFPLQK